MRFFVAAAFAALVCCLPASASTGYYAKWRCSAPCLVKVDYTAMPASEQPLVQAAMDKWSVSGSVRMVAATKSANVVVRPCVPGAGCGFITYPKWSKQTDTLHAVTIEISSQWFGWDGMPLVYCHELGHSLGFIDGSIEPDPNLPPDQTSTSCMAGTGPDPGVEDYALLRLMYP